MSIVSMLSSRLAAAFEAVAGEPVDPVLRRSQRADFQAEGALPLARRLNRPPREVAMEVSRAVDLAGLGTAEVSGPGFLNLTVDNAALGALLTTMAADERLGVPPAVEPETVVVDYSAPNVAKEMHVGHLRSTVIGDATVRLLEWLGHRVVRANHLGDWGTPFGMLIEHLLDVGEAEAASELSIGDLDGFYTAARTKFDNDDAFKERARRRVVALQSGDEQTRRLWRLLVAESETHFLAVYDRLDVRLTRDDFVGESFYNDLLAPMVADLDALGLLERSGGADCVFPPGFTGRDGQPLPMIVRKSDGGFGYGATDLAAIRHRTAELGATRLLYVIGLPQRQHLELAYAVARRAGWLEAPTRAEHVGFGSVLGADGRMLRSRAGATIKLSDLLDEAVARAAELVRNKSPHLDEGAVGRVAQAVGVGVLKYADLSSDRVKDYTFDWGRMLALHGNTAPYLQYAYARICSIHRRAGLDPPHGAAASTTSSAAGAPCGVAVVVADPAEHALAIELLGFGDVIADVAETLEFHRLAAHLYAVASAFAVFFERCPVLKAAPAVRESRLALCDLTARVLRQGLHLLGIRTLEQM
jgi:arginyl-tRNA synthetase